MSDSIVVTGLGFVCPLGTGPAQVWEAWSNDQSGVRRLTDDDPRRARHVDPSALPKIGHAGFVRGFQPREYIKSTHLRRMDWCSRMIVASTAQAVADAGLRLEDDSSQVRTAVVMGSCYGNQRETEKYLTRVLRTGPGAGQPILFPNLVLNAASGYAAIELSMRGPNLSVSEHEASGEIAIATAVDLLRAGMCDRVAVGGADEFGSVYLGALGERRLLDGRSSPGAARVNARRGRIVPGEGAAVLLLEWASAARTRGRKPYATVGVARSGALPSDTYAAAEPGASARCMLELLEAPDASARPISAIIGGANGSLPRDTLDRALVDLVTNRQAGAPSYIDVDHLVGDWGARGALTVGLASLAAHHGNLPGTSPSVGPPQRILIPGSGRSGVVVPIAVDAIP